MKIRKPVHKVVSFIVLLALIGVVGGLWYFSSVESKVKRSDVPEITNEQDVIVDFASCVAAGNPIMESYPEQCSANGETYTNEVNANDQHLSTNKISSVNYIFTIQFPKGWYLISDKNSDTITALSIESITPVEGKEGNVSLGELAGSDNRTVFSIFVAESNYQGWTNPDADTQDFTLLDGTVGTKYSQTFTETVEGLGGYAAGDTAYEYIFEKDDVFVHVVYTVLQGELNQVELVDRSVKTLVIR